MQSILSGTGTEWARYAPNMVDGSGSHVISDLSGANNIVFKFGIRKPNHGNLLRERA